MVNYDTLSVSSHLGACLFNLIVPFVLIFVVQFVEGLLGKYIAGAKEIHARPLSLATVEFCMAFRSRFLTLQAKVEKQDNTGLFTLLYNSFVAFLSIAKTYKMINVRTLVLLITHASFIKVMGSAPVVGLFSFSRIWHKYLKMCVFLGETHIQYRDV